MPQMGIADKGSGLLVQTVISHVRPFNSSLASMENIMWLGRDVKENSTTQIKSTRLPRETDHETAPTLGYVVMRFHLH